LNLLLDTHALLWWLLDDERLSARARTHIGAAGNTILVSSASSWEIATKHRLGKLGLEGWDPVTLPEELHRHRFDVLPVSLEHGLEAGLLTGPHRDPFDRMLIAQCHIEAVPIVTRDPVFDVYGVEVLW
jgi:PIN domain nuclease of toxin-antitoxin system